MPYTHTQTRCVPSFVTPTARTAIRVIIQLVSCTTCKQGGFPAAAHLQLTMSSSSSATNWLALAAQVSAWSCGQQQGAWPAVHTWPPVHTWSAVRTWPALNTKLVDAFQYQQFSKQLCMCAVDGPKATITSAGNAACMPPLQHTHRHTHLCTKHPVTDSDDDRSIVLLQHAATSLLNGFAVSTVTTQH